MNQDGLKSFWDDEQRRIRERTRYYSKYVNGHIMTAYRNEHGDYLKYGDKVLAYCSNSGKVTINNHNNYAKRIRDCIDAFLECDFLTQCARIEDGTYAQRDLNGGGVFKKPDSKPKRKHRKKQAKQAKRVKGGMAPEVFVPRREFKDKPLDD